MGRRKVSVTLSIDEELLREIDSRRGLAKRSTFVEDLIRRGLSAREGGEVIDLLEFCRGVKTMKECVEKIKREIPDYKNKVYRIVIDIPEGK